MKRLSATIIVVIIIATLSLCGCTTTNTVKLTEVTHSIFYAPQYVAMALGYFDEYGITLDVTNGNGADNVMTALLTNETDIGLMGCEANIYVYLQGKKDFPKVVAQLTKRDGSFLVGRTNVTNFDYTGIEGSTVLMGRTGGMPAMILQYVLNNKGYTDGVNITMDYSIQFGVLAPAFTGGVGDYVPLFEPTASQLVKENKGYILSAIGMDSGEIPYTCYSVSPSFAKKYPDKVTNFITAVWKGVDYVNTHTARQCAEIIAPYFVGTSLDILESAMNNYKTYDVWNSTPVTDRQAFERIQDIMQNAGELTTRVNYDNVVNNDFVQ